MDGHYNAVSITISGLFVVTEFLSKRIVAALLNSDSSFPSAGMIITETGYSSATFTIS